MSGRQPDGAAAHHSREPEVVEALETLEAHGIFDPWGIDDILVDEVVPELRAIRSLLQSGQLPGGDGQQVRSLTGLLEEIERNTSAVVAPELNRQNLPIGLVGVTTEPISEGNKGLASFTVEGSQFTAEVTASGEIGGFDPIVIFGEGNQVRPIPEEEQQPERRTVPRYVTSGPDPIEVTNTTFETFEVEDEDGKTLVADTVVLFFDEAIDVSFTTDDDDQVIPLTAEKSPATLSSVQGIRATRVLYRQNADAAGPADLTIIALK